MALVEVYRLDETGTADRLPQIGNGPAMVVDGAITNDTGILGNGAKYAEVGSVGGDVSAGALASVRDWSISLWVKHLSWGGFVATEFRLRSTDFNTQVGISLGGEATQISAFTSLAFVPVMANGGIPSLDQWYHVVATWNNAANRIRCYVNGSLISEDDDPAIEVVEDMVRIDLAANFTNTAIVDQVCIYDEEVDSTVVTQLYNSGAGFDPTAEVATSGAARLFGCGLIR